MTLVKSSLIAALAVGCLGSVSFAADNTLEEAIKGINVNGYLRYRYNSDAYENQGGVDKADNTSGRHQYRAVANFSTAPMDNISINLGVLYRNEGATTLSDGFFGTGLGAGSDGEFGVTTFYATIAPKEHTTTAIHIGKQLIDTPVSMAGDFDRGTGIIITNQDISGLTLVGAAFDTYALDDINFAATGIPGANSITGGLYGLAAVYSIPNLLTAEVWWFNAEGVADSVLYANLAYNQDLDGFALRAGINYSMSQLATSGKHALFVGQEQANDLLKLSLGATVGPVLLDVGYLLNTQAGYSTIFDDQGQIISSIPMGQLWWQNNATRTNIGIAKRATGNAAANPVMSGEKDKLNVLYGTIGAKNIADSGINVFLTYVNGSSELTDVQNQSNKRTFQEITPVIQYQYNAKLSFETFYAMLSTDVDNGVNTVTENRNRVRFQTLYKF